MGSKSLGILWMYLSVLLCLCSVLELAIACPRACTCTKSRMDCSFKNLKAVPQPIPSGVKKL